MSLMLLLLLLLLLLSSCVTLHCTALHGPQLLPVCLPGERPCPCLPCRLQPVPHHASLPLLGDGLWELISEGPTMYRKYYAR